MNMFRVQTYISQESGSSSICTQSRSYLDTVLYPKYNQLGSGSECAGRVSRTGSSNIIVYIYHHFFLAPGLCQSHYYHGTYIIDGNAEIAAQVWSLIGNLIYLRHLIKINSGR